MKKHLASAVAVIVTFMPSCGHDRQRPVVTPAGIPDRTGDKADLAPGARPEERNHLIEADWKEVVVKTRKQGPTVLAAVKLVAPNIRLFHAGAPDAGEEREQPAREPTKRGPESPPEVVDLATELHRITPLQVDHVDILDGQVAFVDTSRKERPELWLHDLQLSAENLTTRVPLAEGRPVLLTATATLGHSGKVSIFITAAPFETGLTFSGRAAVVGLQTAELYRFIAPATDMQAPRGTIDLFVEFDCRNGELTGGVKPVLKNLEIRPDDKNPWTILKAWATDVAIHIFSDRLRQRNAIATVLPIKGTLTAPEAQLWPTIFGVMRNAFVEGLTSGYAFLPPATAKTKQGVVKQGVEALTGAGPPPAQPTRADAKAATPMATP
jgi:hypothetical protein